jgi:ribose-phosphate pyrophosphokinase
MERGRLSLVACSSGRALAERITDRLKRVLLAETGSDQGARLVESDEVHFANGEIKTVIREPIRGDDVYVVQAAADPLRPYTVNDNLMALVTALNAAHQADADHITVVLPQFPYARQERKKVREGITAKQVARLLEIAGANRVLTLDIHAPAICGFFENARMDNVYASGPILAHFRRHYPVENLVVVSPDVGSAERARYYSKALHAEMAVVDKERDYSRPGTVQSVRLVGDVRDHDVFMADDLIDTGGTILAAAELLRSRGARDIHLACSLPYLTGTAVDRFDRAHEKGIFKVLIGTDAVFRGADFIRDHPWFEEVSVADLFANVIAHVNRKQSVSVLLDADDRRQVY